MKAPELSPGLPIAAIQRFFITVNKAFYACAAGLNDWPEMYKMDLEHRMRELSYLEKEIILDFEDHEKKTLSGAATFSKDANRRFGERHPGIRPAFSRDADRILHSFAFTRYIDKTQVFYLSDNDCITHRVIHVQLVSKIARVIARALHLNEDLVEAIALGHDIGHTPFGHEGESNLSAEITERLKVPFHFRHSIQSVRFLDRLEGQYTYDQGKSLNLTLQVLDGILCHDGENTKQYLKPNRSKSWGDHENDILSKRSQKNVDIMPMTLEGCLVRMVDVIAYLGRDIQDAISVGLIAEGDFPKCLGESNREIVNALVMDIIENSRGNDEICFSKHIFEKLLELKAFNYDHIYNNTLIKTQKDKIKDMFLALYNKLLAHVKDEKRDSPIFLDHINLVDAEDLQQRYYKETSPEVIVVDFIAGMTDTYFINIFNELYFPRKLPFNYRQIERMTGLTEGALRTLISQMN